MPDLGKRLDEAIRGVKTLPRQYQERALLGLRALLNDWQQRATQRLDERQQAVKQRLAQVNVEFSRRLVDLGHVLKKRR